MSSPWILKRTGYSCDLRSNRRTSGKSKYVVKHSDSFALRKLLQDINKNVQSLNQTIILRFSLQKVNK